MCNIDEKIRTYFNHLHQNPEVSFKEVETTKTLMNWLTKEGFHPKRFKETTGLYVELGQGAPKIGVRVDMDALWQEVEGKMQANHSCGHDAHMTIGLAVLLLLKEQNIKGTIRVIFQPAEEIGEGAYQAIKEGLIEDLDFLFGVHLRPLEELENGMFAPSLHHGASQCIEGEIIGEDSHAARPHLGKNAIETGMDIMNLLNTIHTNPMVPASIKVTSFHAGSSHNTIPGYATFTVDMRAQTNETMDKLTNDFYRIVKGTEITNDVRIKTKTLLSLAAAEVSEVAQDLLAKAITAALGEKHLAPPLYTPGGEDFHVYTRMYPHLHATMLGVGCHLLPGLHHPDMSFDQSQLLPAAQIMVQALKETVHFYNGQYKQVG